MTLLRTLYYQNTLEFRKGILVNAQPKLRQIIKKISIASGVSETDLKGRKRSMDITTARAYYCYRARLDVVASIMQIGDVINLHHATVIHNSRLMEWLLAYKNETDKKVRMAKELDRRYNELV